MNVANYLKANGLQSLIDNFKIKAKVYEELMVLNYTYKKTDPIVMECRALILDKDFKIVSRSFDSFFNYDNDLKIDTQTIILEKLDGSLMCVYNHKDIWYARTRSSAYGEHFLGKTTYSDFFVKTLNCENFQDFCNNHLDKDYTYIFEVTSPLIRIKTLYFEDKIWLLAVRNNKTGDYLTNLGHLKSFFTTPKKFVFQNLQECLKSVDHQDEGFVVYDITGRPIAKIKSAKYLNKKNKTKTIDEDKLLEFILHADCIYKRYFDKPIAEFGREINKYRWSSLAFKARKNNFSSLVEQYNTENLKYKIYLFNKLF